jgi:hypothetical protein
LQFTILVSSYLIACYCGISLTVVGIGLLSKAASPWIADLTFGIVTTVAAVVALAVEIKVGKKSAAVS